MAIFVNEVSRTFGEYLLIPGLTTRQCTPQNVSLTTPLVRFARGEEPRIRLNIPFVSAIMQSVSNDTLAIELARNGGLSFIYGSQPIAEQAEMVRRVKKFKAGFVSSDSNIRPDATLRDVLALRARMGHSTIGVTEDGSPNGRLLGIVTSRDYRIGTTPEDALVKDFMTPFSKLKVGRLGISLKEANNIIWEHKLNTLPIIDENDNLVYLVFRKDYDAHKDNPVELSNKATKELLVGAGINTRDYAERVPALIEAGADVLCIDSSDGYSEWQYDTLRWIREKYGEDQFMAWRRSYDVPPPPIDPDGQWSQFRDVRYADVPEAERPLSECLKDVVARMLPYWESDIIPDLRAGRTVLVAAHGNSLRALVKHLDEIDDQTISGLNIPTGIPLLYELDDALRPVVKGGRYLDPEAAEAGQKAVANQGKK